MYTPKQAYSEDFYRVIHNLKIHGTPLGDVSKYADVGLNVKFMSHVYLSALVTFDMGFQPVHRAPFETGAYRGGKCYYVQLFLEGKL